jgi:phosphatidylserine/phosphatidylglycerophosphate/cardiolipin synthase-like enzyme
VGIGSPSSKRVSVAKCAVRLFDANSLTTGGGDAFTRELKAILIERAANGVEVRLLYDPFGSLFRFTRRYKRELIAVRQALALRHVSRRCQASRGRMV